MKSCQKHSHGTSNDTPPHPGEFRSDEWFDSQRDRNARNKIRVRLTRVSEGNLGDYRSVGEGVCELRISYGPGYRIYFGQIGTTVVLLLCGGEKSNQENDIETAREYWREHRSRD